MNLKEGMRRLSLLLGVLGAILGSCFAYVMRTESFPLGALFSMPILGFLLPWAAIRALSEVVAVSAIEEIPS